MKVAFVPAAILVLGSALVAIMLATIATGSEADYADLVPGPDNILWEEGDETVLWLSTNRRGVDLRIDSVSLGIGDIDRLFPESGEAMVLGRSEGCKDWAVSLLSATNITDSGFSIEGEVDRNDYNQPVTVHGRVYLDGDLGSALAFSVDLGPTDNAFAQDVTTATDAVYVVEASSAADFPFAITRSVRVDTSGRFSTTDTRAYGCWRTTEPASSPAQNARMWSLPFTARVAWS